MCQQIRKPKQYKRCFARFFWLRCQSTRAYNSIIEPARKAALSCLLIAVPQRPISRSISVAHIYLHQRSSAWSICDSYESDLSDKTTYDKEVLRWKAKRARAAEKEWTSGYHGNYQQLSLLFLQCLCLLQRQGGHLVLCTESRPTRAEPCELSGSLLWLTLWWTPKV